MKEYIICFRKGQQNCMGFIAKKPQGGSMKKYKILSEQNKSYIRAANGAAIDTGYTWTTNNIKIEICFKGLQTQNSTLFGAEASESTSTSGKYSLNPYMVNSSNLKFQWNVGGKESLGNSGELAFTSTKHTLSIEVNSSTSKVTCKLDGVEQSYTNSDASISNKTLSNVIFGSKTASGITQLAPCDLYYCKMWDNGTLVRDLYPVKKNNKIDKKLASADSLYDYVTRTFFTNITGNGTLTYYTE